MSLKRVRGQFTENIANISKWTQYIQETIEKYHLPNKYNALVALLNRQKAAMENLLSDKPLGYEASELQFDSNSFLYDPHLQNLSHLAGTCKTMTDDKREDFFGTAQQALHTIKNYGSDYFAVAISKDIFNAAGYKRLCDNKQRIATKIRFMTQLYLISPPQIDIPTFRKSLEEALAAGQRLQDPCLRRDDKIICAFQLRLKDADDDTIKRAIKELLPICSAHEVAFIINDRADLCAAFTCDGVHVGQEDLEKTSIAKIRSLVGEKAAIGVTCHASRHLAMEAAEAGADYVAFGAFYETTSKPKEKLEKWGTPTPDILEWWSTYTTVPCVAIGGITLENAKPLVGAGADFIAVITSVWSHPKGAAEAVKAFQAVIPA